MFLEAVILGVLVGWLRKGRLKYLEHFPLQWLSLAVVALFLQVGLWLDFAFAGGAREVWYPYLHVLSYLLLLGFICLNLRQRAMLIIGLGVLLNLMVITANQGKMPVDPEVLEPEMRQELLRGEGSPVHAPLTEETNLGFLGDHIPLPHTPDDIISVGDIFLAAGLAVLIQKAMQPPHRSYQGTQGGKGLSEGKG